MKSRSALRALSGLAVAGVVGIFSGCGDDGEVKVNRYTCVAPDCTTLNPGLIGAYTSVAVSGKTIWVAGYAEADWYNEYSWGDLAVGTWDGTKVGWAAIDGVPSENPVDPKLYNKDGWRGGQTDPGDDVGLWTSIAVDDAGNPAVAYYDRTNKSLKFAQRIDATWQINTIEVKAQSDIGRYAKLLFVENIPTIAYLAIEPGADGAVTSKIRIATATSAKPGAADWTFEDAVVDNATPCRAYNCSLSDVCVVETNKCMPKETTCDPKCSSGTACVNVGMGAACSDIRDASKIDTYPDAVGDYVSFARDPAGALALAFYDRIHGNLVIASKSSGSWKSIVIDGAAADGTDTGDKGIGTSLFIDDKGDWHISYVDGLAEGVRYAQVTKGTTVKLTAIVDDGIALNGMPNADGQHILGDDSAIFVGPSGEIHITYQDATAGKLRHAVGTPSGDMISWKVTVIEQDGFAGAFSKPFLAESKLMLANWWRMGGEEPKGDVNILTP